MCPAGDLSAQFAPSATCISWKEQVHCSSEVRSVLQCPSLMSGLLPLTVGTLAVPDDLRHIASQGEEDWDPAYVLHLFPVATLRNLLPYTVRYMLEVHLRVWAWHCYASVCFLSMPTATVTKNDIAIPRSVDQVQSQVIWRLVTWVENFFSRSNP